jgi:hypothetical protein
MDQSAAQLLGVQDPTDPTAPVSPAPKLTAKQFCRALLATPQYRESLLRRILMDDLPPAVECKLWEYAYGKPVDRIEHTGKDGHPIETITEVRRVIIRSHIPEDEPVVKEVTH